jgi:hypothetical protein
MRRGRVFGLARPMHDGAMQTMAMRIVEGPFVPERTMLRSRAYLWRVEEYCEW